MRGPEFSRAKPVTLNIDGNIIKLMAPRHKTKYPDPQLYVKNKNGLETGFQPARNGNWEYCNLLRRSWSYWRSWFGKHQGELFFNVFALMRVPEWSFKNTSFFHPKSFEYVLSNFLDSQYGLKTDGNEALCQGPVDWHCIKQLPVFSVRFAINTSTQELCFVFPITNKHLVVFNFHFMSYNMVEVMKPLALDIIDSVTLELSSKSQQQWDTVKSECDDISLTENFSPLKWPVKAEDVE